MERLQSLGYLSRCGIAVVGLTGHHPGHHFRQCRRHFRAQDVHRLGVFQLMLQQLLGQRFAGKREAREPKLW